MVWIKRIIKRNPKKFKRILIFVILALFLSAFIFLPNVAFADWVGWLFENESYARDISQLIRTISHVVYVFIWPCLAIAGSALDNSLVYGSFLHLDAALWNIWNIMKNYANFALWFIFIFTIVKNLFAWSFGGNSDPIKWAKDTVVKTFIAWVLVQMSRFIVAALIDLSTILIYAVWGMPLSMLWTYNKEMARIPIMKLNVEIENNDSFRYYSYWWHNFSPCFLANKNIDGDVDSDDNASLKWLTGEYIAWRKYLYMSSWTTFESGYCVLNGYLYSYVEPTTWFFCEGQTWCYTNYWGTISQLNDSYFTQLKNYLNWIDTWTIESERDSCFLINAYNVEYKGETGQQCERICADYWEVSYSWDIYSAQGFTLQNLMENSKWRVWPFITMYSSILNYQDLVLPPGNDSVVWNLFGLLINTFFAFVLFVPIAILMILLVIRIGYLWVVIAVSPILILANFGPLWDKLKGKSLFKKFSPKEIITVIFSPVIVVFAVSLCIIFLSAVYKSEPNREDASNNLYWANTLSAFGIEKVRSSEVWDSGGWWNSQGCIMPVWTGSSAGKNVSSETYSILWLVDININVQNYNHWKDIFVWVLMELLATWIVWFFMKFAIWMMGETLWEKWKKLMGSAEKLMWNVPIIPLPGWFWSIGISKLPELWLSWRVDRVSTKMDEISRKTLEKKFPWMYDIDNSKEDSTWSVSTESINKVVEEIKVNKIDKYEKLSSTSKATLERMYWTNAAQYYTNFENYYVNNNYSSIIAAGNQLKWTPSKAKTNADALKFNKTQLDAAVRSDPNWIAWAGGMVSWSVQTSDWVFMVDYLDGNSVPWNQQYEIVTREVYEKRHFPAATLEKGMESITRNDYDKYNDDQKNALNEHFKQIEEELSELQRIQEKRNKGENLEWNEELVEKSILTNLNISAEDLKKLKESLWIS